MKGVIVEKPGAPFTVVEDLEPPEPGPDQILVKSLAVAINQIDGYMQQVGLLALKWPVVLGCDASGTVVKVGEKAASKFKPGDEVCGCTRLGSPGHGPFQEYFLMDAPLTFRKPENITTYQAATVGVGSLETSLGVFDGLGVEIPDTEVPPDPIDEWVIILGGSGSVGKYAIQLAKACGFKVLATSSSFSTPLVLSLGADATVDYKASEEEQLNQIVAATKGNFSRIFDTTAQNHDLAMRIFQESMHEQPSFTTTNSWTRIEDTAPDNVKVYQIELGFIGRDDAKELNSRLESYIPVITDLIEQDRLKPSPYEVIGNGGFESIPQAVELLQKGGGKSSKLVVQLQQIPYARRLSHYGL